MFFESVIGALFEIIIEGGFERLSRNSNVIRVLKKVGYNPSELPRDFDGLYTYALVYYGSTKPPQLTRFFNNAQVIDVFKRAFNDNDLSIILNDFVKRPLRNAICSLIELISEPSGRLLINSSFLSRKLNFSESSLR